jgi:hypothetical protein
MQEIRIVDACQIIHIQVHFKILVIVSKIDAQNRNFGVDQNAGFHFELNLVFEKQIANLAQRLEGKPKIYRTLKLNKLEYLRSFIQVVMSRDTTAQIHIGTKIKSLKKACIKFVWHYSTNKCTNLLE